MVSLSSHLLPESVKALFLVGKFTSKCGTGQITVLIKYGSILILNANSNIIIKRLVFFMLVFKVF